MRIYVASSWRNERQPVVVDDLRAAGHEVYDFRHPEPGNDGFHWSEIDPSWQGWNGRQFANALAHPVAEAGFALDKAGLDWCDACVLVLPSGRSAHLEAGYAIGQGKPTAILLDQNQEAELMYKLAATLVHNMAELVTWLDALGSDQAAKTLFSVSIGRAGAEQLREILRYMDNELANRDFPEWEDRGMTEDIAGTAGALLAELDRVLGSPAALSR